MSKAERLVLIRAANQAAARKMFDAATQHEQIRCASLRRARA